MSEQGYTAPPPDPRLERMHHFVDDHRVVVIERKLNTVIVEYLEGPKHETREEVPVVVVETRT